MYEMRLETNFILKFVTNRHKLRDRQSNQDDTKSLCLMQHSETVWFKLFGRLGSLLELLPLCMLAQQHENKRNWDKIKKKKRVLAEEILHWEQWNRWDQRERMKRISLDKADEKGTWINDGEKKTTTSTALAVSRFHLDGASHLEEREERATEVSAGDLGCRCYNKRPQTRGVKALSPILKDVLRDWSKCLG